MKILAVGGGSGGHVTPVVAVLRELRKTHPKAEVRFWCDNAFAPQARAIMSSFDSNIPVRAIMAGKFRRYYHLSVMRQLLWPSVVLLNIRDGLFVLVGILESILRLIIWRPDVIFAKGGYVCLPVGFAAHLLHIPLVIHDSDAHPGLTNRVLSRWATMIATGAPLEYYSYPANKSHYVGIPISSEFHEFTDQERRDAKVKWGIDEKSPLIVITGGGLGAQRINDAIIFTLNNLLKIGSIVLISGVGKYDELRSIVPPNSDKFQLHAFVSKDMALLLGAADVVITRAGATTILELAALARPTILIPNGKLTGGHQLKNATVYSNKSAVIVINENDMVDNPDILTLSVQDIISNSDRALKMAHSLASFARPNAARDVADMIISSIK